MSVQTAEEEKTTITDKIHFAIFIRSICEFSQFFPSNLLSIDLCRFRFENKKAFNHPSHLEIFLCFVENKVKLLFIKTTFFNLFFIEQQK